MGAGTIRSGAAQSVLRSGAIAAHSGCARIRGIRSEQLETIFPAVLPPLALPIDKRPQKFSFFFAMSNSNPAAVGLATRIANHILKDGMSSHKRPR